MPQCGSKLVENASVRRASVSGGDSASRRFGPKAAASRAATLSGATVAAAGDPETEAEGKPLEEPALGTLTHAAVLRAKGMPSFLTLFDGRKLEAYLNDADFREHLGGYDRSAFYSLPPWKQANLKKAASLF